LAFDVEIFEIDLCYFSIRHLYDELIAGNFEGLESCGVTFGVLDRNPI